MCRCADNMLVWDVSRSSRLDYNAMLPYSAVLDASRTHPRHCHRCVAWSSSLHAVLVQITTVKLDRAKIIAFVMSRERCRRIDQQSRCLQELFQIVFDVSLLILSQLS